MGRRVGFKVPIAVVAGFIPGLTDAFGHGRPFNDGSGDSVSDVLIGSYTGYQTPGSRKYSGGKAFSTWRLGYGLYPLLAGFAVHKIVGGMLGVNRMLGAAKVPYIRL